MVERDKSSIRKGSALMMVLIVTGVLSALVFSTLAVIQRNSDRVSAKSWEMEVTALAQKGVAIGTEPGLLR